MPAYFTSRQSVLRRLFEHSHRCCLVAAPPVRIATVHLLRSPANATHLQRSLEQSERGEWLEPALIEPGQAGAGS